MPEPIAVRSAAGESFHKISFDQPVPRQSVHRAAIAEVFVTDGLQLGDDRFLAGAQWPRDHAFYHPVPPGLTDPLLVAETMRQVMVHLAHRFQGVPAGSRFVGSDIAFELTDTRPLRNRPEPMAAILEARWDWQEKERLPLRFRLDVTLTVDGVTCGHGHIGVLVLDERRYRIVRGRARSRAGDAPASGSAERIPPGEVGRLRAKDVVIGRDPAGGWRLALDQSHPALFDHPVDHVPLMGLAEGVRQLGHLLVHDGRPDEEAWYLSGFEAVFHTFTELDQPTGLAVRSAHGIAEASRRVDLAIDVEQSGTTVASTRSVWSPAARQPPHAAG